LLLPEVRVAVLPCLLTGAAVCTLVVFCGAALAFLPGAVLFLPALPFVLPVVRFCRAVVPVFAGVPGEVLFLLLSAVVVLLRFVLFPVVAGLLRFVPETVVFSRLFFIVLLFLPVSAPVEEFRLAVLLLPFVTAEALLAVEALFFKTVSSLLYVVAFVLLLLSVLRYELFAATLPSW